jgi:hypothetical protein
VEPVADPEGLAKNYLVKERTPQAGYGRSDLGGRIRGAHPIAAVATGSASPANLNATQSRLVSF